MMALTGGRGFRVTGTKRGITKPPKSTRPERLVQQFVGAAA